MKRHLESHPSVALPAYEYSMREPPDHLTHWALLNALVPSEEDRDNIVAACPPDLELYATMATSG
jgi:hypothetical protein